MSPRLLDDATGTTRASILDLVPLAGQLDLLDVGAPLPVANARAWAEYRREQDARDAALYGDADDCGF